MLPKAVRLRARQLYRLAARARLKAAETSMQTIQSGSRHTSILQSNRPRHSSIAITGRHLRPHVGLDDAGCGLDCQAACPSRHLLPQRGFGAQAFGRVYVANLGFSCQNCTIHLTLQE